MNPRVRILAIPLLAGLLALPALAAETPSRADLLTGSRQAQDEDAAASKPAAAQSKQQPAPAQAKQREAGKRPKACRDGEGRRVKC